MLAFTVATLLAFAPAPLSHRSPMRTHACSLRMLSPLEVVANPLRKFEAPVTSAAGASKTAAAAAASNNILADLPIEVIGLFAVLILAGIAGLVKSSGALSESAPTVGLGESREDLSDQAQTAEAEMESMTQAEKEKKYFSQIAGDLAGKRGGSGKNRKKKRK